MRILQETAIVLAVMSLLTACATTTREYDTDRDVISAVVRQMCKQPVAEYVVLASATSIVNPAFTPSSIEESARRSLLERNKNPVALPVVHTCKFIRLVDREELDRYFEISDTHEQWLAFYSKFSNASGIMSFSLPGYSTQGDLAVVQIASSCGETCGGGSFWVLRKVSGRWEVEVGKVIPGWQS